MREAASVCESVLRECEDHFDALHLLGVIHLQSGNTQSGLNLVQKAIAQRPEEAIAYLSKGNALLSLAQPKEAADAFGRALALQPLSAVAHSNLANALLALGHAQDALVSADRALEIDLGFASAHNNRGNALLQLERPSEALPCFDRAIDLDRNHAAAHTNRGRALLSLARAAEALESHERALAINPRMIEALTNKGNVLLRMRQPAEALVCYEQALQLRPDSFKARNNRCQALLDLRRPVEALAAVDEVLRGGPNDAKALTIRALALVDLGRRDEAIEHLTNALAGLPDEPDLLNVLADTQMTGRAYEQAALTFQRLLGAAPQRDYAAGYLCEVLLNLCDWPRLAAPETLALAGVRAGKRSASPFTLMALQSVPADQVACARVHLELAAPLALRRAALRGHRHERIRLAYVSPDFREHPVANQIVRLLETHDRSRFEIIAVALEKPDGSEVARRIRAGCERLLDVSHLDEASIARLLRDFEIDIAVDLSGHTFLNRVGVFAHRIAPVQINFLGFPGTIGSACHDYIIADHWVIPEQHEAHYTERVAWLPHSYQPYDPRIAATECPLTRRDVGLPDDAFVFCCFNNRFKIRPPHFDVWMQILHRVPSSVLWLTGGATAPAERLRREAQSRGIAPERLIFAPRMDSRDLHVSRYQLADLFLDTLPFNAHATASDALWAGLPLLTCPGDTFAGRVAAGMLMAVRLGELIATSIDDYEEKAVALAQPGSELAHLRERLQNGRATHPLFDVDRYRRAIERAYERMSAEAAAGRPASSFAVSD